MSNRRAGKEMNAEKPVDAGSYRRSLLRIALTMSILVALSCRRADEQKSAQSSTGYRMGTNTWSIFRGDRELSGVAGGSLAPVLKRLWSVKAGNEISSSPVIGTDKVYVGSEDSKVYCVRRHDGGRVWIFDAAEAVEAPPLLLRGTLYVGTRAGMFFALDAETGEEKWRFETGHPMIGSANWLQSGDGLQIVVGSHDASMYCLASDSGEQLWQYKTDYLVNGAPAVTDNSLLVFGGCDEVLHVVSASNGQGVAKVPVGSFIAASVAVSGDRAVVGQYAGQLVCADLSTMTVAWRYGDEEEGEPFFSSPAISNRRVVAGSRDNYVHCVSMETGRRIWKFRTGSAVDSSPVVCGDKVVAGSRDGRLYMLGLEDGRKIWSYDVGAPISGSPAVADGMVVIGDGHGWLHAFVAAGASKRNK